MLVLYEVLGHTYYTNDAYLLTRGCNASTRLTALHYLWKDLLGYLIHPDIPTRSANLKVADVATGNGIWLHDLANTMPASCGFHGFDISLDQVGPTAWLPSNIHMHTWDIFEEPPSKFLSFFDIVHVRLLTFVVKAKDPLLILMNLTKLLKPGGYLQWDEADLSGGSIKAVPGVSTKSLAIILSQCKLEDGWKYQFTQVMDDNGYSGSSLYVYKTGLSMARLWNDLGWKELVNTVLTTPQIMHELEQKGMEEVRNGAAMVFPTLVWVAKKV
ncbi:hypothetical protein GGR58DRAFT_525698 [Xylaria digitata]|nr:hypothetical protein GGR58DRAFT_525698 [Xylaria digitata]